MGSFLLLTGFMGSHMCCINHSLWQRAKREKKHQTYTLCEVCNIQLNSLAQAQIHYNGKSHQKRLKQINKGKPASSQGSAHRYHPCADTGVAKKKTRCPPKRVPSADRFFTLCRLTVQPPQSYSVGGQRSSGQLTGKPAGARPDYRGRWCATTLSLDWFIAIAMVLRYLCRWYKSDTQCSPVQSSPLLATLPVLGRSVQPQLDLKHFLHFRLNGSAPLSLFPNFSTNQAEAHYKGHKHTRKLKGIEAQKHKKQRSPGAMVSAARKRDRGRDRGRGSEPLPALTEPLPALMDTRVQESESLQACQEEKVEESQGSSRMLTPNSEVSSLELPRSVSPLVSPASELSESISE
ncbi:UNVERIFIED_CONTAM: hypothetical protein FKN15_057099 [Acipenser sinensis]